MTQSAAERSATPLRRFAWLAVGAAVVTMALKTVAWLLTGSVGLLSDALESTVNLGAALLAVFVLWWSAKPADEEYAYGHGKAEYLSAGIEGTLILVAAISIAYAAVQRLISPAGLEDLGVGLAVAGVAALINLVVGLTLIRAGTRRRSVTIEADGRHLLTDVWTSAGVLVGVGAVAVTGWDPLDPLVALAVSANIVITGVRLVRRSLSGFMDRALPEGDLEAIQRALAPYEADGVRFHAMRTRQSGQRAFAEVHVLVPGDWSVKRGHDLLEEIEEQMRAAVPGLTALTHLEPVEDRVSFLDLGLDRPGRSAGAGRKE